MTGSGKMQVLGYVMLLGAAQSSQIRYVHVVWRQVRPGRGVRPHLVEMQLVAYRYGPPLSGQGNVLVLLLSFPSMRVARMTLSPVRNDDENGALCRNLEGQRDRHDSIVPDEARCVSTSGWNQRAHVPE